jgi:hypothetical protein
MPGRRVVHDASPITKGSTSLIAIAIIGRWRITLKGWLRVEKAIGSEDTKFEEPINVDQSA